MDPSPNASKIEPSVRASVPFTWSAPSPINGTAQATATLYDNDCVALDLPPGLDGLLIQPQWSERNHNIPVSGYTVGNQWSKSDMDDLRVAASNALRAALGIPPMR